MKYFLGVDMELSKEEIEGYLSAVAAQIHTVNPATIGINLLVRKRYGELSDDEYDQLFATLYGS